MYKVNVSNDEDNTLWLEDETGLYAISVTHNKRLNPKNGMVYAPYVKVRDMENNEIIMLWTEEWCNSLEFCV
jgi:hypothetical protein